jgi:hypothetical protein
MSTGAPLKGFALPVLGLVLLNVALFLGPLLFVAPQLVAVKRRGLREYGRVATAYVRGFDAKWLRGGAPADEPLLGSGDIQALNDLAGSFGVIRRMRVVPFGPRLVLILVAGTLAPMAPLLFLASPFEELLGLAAKLVLGGWRCPATKGRWVCAPGRRVRALSQSDWRIAERQRRGRNVACRNVT